MEIEERTEGDLTTLFLKDKIVGDRDAEILRDKIEALIEEGKVHVVFDLAEVPYVDSAGLGEIVHSYTLLHGEKGKLTIRNPNERLRKLLSRTRLAWVGEGDSDDAER